MLMNLLFRLVSHPRFNKHNVWHRRPVAALIVLFHAAAQLGGAIKLTASDAWYNFSNARREIGEINRAASRLCSREFVPQ